MSSQSPPPRSLSNEEALAAIGETPASGGLSNEEALAAIGETPAASPPADTASRAGQAMGDWWDLTKRNFQEAGSVDMTPRMPKDLSPGEWAKTTLHNVSIPARTAFAGIGQLISPVTAGVQQALSGKEPLPRIDQPGPLPTEDPLGALRHATGQFAGQVLDPISDPARLTAQATGADPEAMQNAAILAATMLPAVKPVGRMVRGIPEAIRTARNAALDARMEPAPRLPAPMAETRVGAPEPALPPGTTALERIPVPAPRGVIEPAPRGVALNKALSEGNVTPGEVRPRIDVTSPRQRVVGRMTSERSKPPSTQTAQAPAPEVTPAPRLAPRPDTRPAEPPAPPAAEAPAAKPAAEAPASVAEPAAQTGVEVPPAPSPSSATGTPPSAGSSPAKGGGTGGKPPIAREPWQMTREEFGKTEWDAYNRQLIDERSGLRSGTVEVGPFSRHKTKASGLRAVDAELKKITQQRNEKGYGSFGDHYGVVARAVREGKPVPPEVLAEYPDISPAVEAPPKPISTPRPGPTVGMGLGGAQPLIKAGMKRVAEETSPTPFADPAAAKAAETIKLRMTPEGGKGPLKERMGDAARTVYDEMVRYEGPMARAEKAAEGKISETGPTAMLQYGQGASARKQFNLETAGELEGQHVPVTVREGLSGVRRRDMRDFSAYLIAKRFHTRYDPKGLLTGVEPAESSALVKGVEADPARASWVRAQQAIHDSFDAVMRNWADAERMPPDFADQIRQDNPAYVPVRRMVAEQGNRIIGSTGPMKTMKVKTVTGGEQPFADPLSVLRQEQQRMIAMADKARAKHALLDAVDQNPEGWKPFVEQIPVDVAKRDVVHYDDILATYEAIRKGAATPEDVARYVSDFERANSGPTHMTFRNGKPQVYKVNSPALAELMRGDVANPGNVIEFADTVARKTIDPLGRMIRVGTTGASLPFAAWNVVKDLRAAMLYTDTANPFRALTDIGRGLGHSVAGAAAELTGKRLDTKMSRAYKGLGVEGLVGSDIPTAYRDLTKYGKAGIVDRTADYVKRPWMIVTDPVRGAIKVAQEVVSAGEGGPRIGEMIGQMRKAGMKPDAQLPQGARVAFANKASGITTNFRLGGRFTKQWNRVEPYVNARIQAFERWRQEWKTNPTRMAARTVAYSVLPQVATWVYTHGDKKRSEAYDRLPIWRRLMWNIPYQRDDDSWAFFSIPTLSEIDLPARAIVTALDGIRGKDREAAVDTAWAVAKDLLPVSGDTLTDALTPNTIQPFMDVQNNRNSNRGGPLVPEGMEGQEQWDPANVARPTTSDTARFASEALRKAGVNIAATKIDHLLTGYTGTVGRGILNANRFGGEEAADVPILGRAMGRASESIYVDRFYDRMEDLEGRRGAFLRSARMGSERTAELAIPAAVGTVLSKLKETLSVLRDEYRAAEDAKAKREIATTMDDIAKTGIEIASPWLVKK